MGMSKVWGNSALQIFIACMIPNLGGIVLFIVLAEKLKEQREPIRSFLEPPDWVSWNLKLKL
jgi:hypothetical protein